MDLQYFDSSVRCKVKAIKVFDNINKLEVDCGNFESESEALDFYNHYSNSFYWLSFHTKVAIKVIEDFKVYNKNDSILNFHSRQSYQTGSKFESPIIIKHIQDGFDLSYESNDNQIFLPIVLYNQFMSSNNDSLKILYAVTLLEIISSNYNEKNPSKKYCQDVKRKTDECDKLLYFAGENNLNLSDEICKYVENYKKVSITKTMKLFLATIKSEKNLCIDINPFVNKLYDARSRLVHNGNLFKNISPEKVKDIIKDLEPTLYSSIKFFYEKN